ncbi:MAG: hypothetical protein HY843_04855 [Bdellovibrio sp.]|nr:hypothetical protein [Bdellovibrio sp.]
MNQKGDLTLVKGVQAFFHELVSEAIGEKQIAVRPETEVYLVNLLNQFVSTDRLYLRDAFGNYREEPLAILLKEALEFPNLEKQKLMFRHLGDVSLYVAGFFQESLNRKLVDVDYYIGVGGVAYDQVASRVGEHVMQLLYKELSSKFAHFVDVFAEVSDKTTPKTEKNILRLYEVWLSTKSKRAAKALKEMGIIPNPNLKKDVQ